MFESSFTFDSTVSKTNRQVQMTCLTCNGDRFVLYGTQQVKALGLSAATFETYAPCPMCNRNTIEYRSFDGRVVRTPDPAKIEEMITR